MHPFVIEPRRLFRWHCVVIAVLVLAHWLVRIVAPPLPILDEEFVRTMVDLDAEGNPASFFSGLAFVACGCAALHLQRNHPGNEGGIFWATLGGLLLFLGFDEAAKIHEGFVVLGKHLVSGRDMFYFTWWTAYVPLILPVVAVLLPGLGRAPAVLRNRLLLGGIVFVCGAVGMDILQGRLAYRITLAGADRVALAARIEWHVLVEETMEMMGVAIALLGLLEHAAHHAPSAGVHLALQEAHRVTRGSASEHPSPAGLTAATGDFGPSAAASSAARTARASPSPRSALR